MSLAHRIIPVMLIDGRRLVKGAAFNAWRTVGIAYQAAKIHSLRGVDELMLLDIAATRENRGPDLGLIEELSECCFMPLAVGGGIRSVEQAKDVLRAGADRVVVCTGHYEVKNLTRDLAHTFGKQAVTITIDVLNDRFHVRCGKQDTKMTAMKAAEDAVNCGAGEILLTDIARDGMLCGYNLSLISEVSNAIDVPVVACGGCGEYDHMLSAIYSGASAVAAGAMFQFTDATPLGAAKYLAQHQITVRVA